MEQRSGGDRAAPAHMEGVSKHLLERAVMSAPEIVPTHADRAEQIHAALDLLTYPAASKDQPGWFLQRTRTGPGQRRPDGTFVIFWVYLHTANLFERPVCDRDGNDLALSCLAMDLQLMAFDACTNGIDARHGGLVSVIIAP